MANNMVGELEACFVDKRRTTAAAASSATPQATPANYDSVSSLRTRLGAINAGFYTSTMLDNMTVNDMQYAVKLNDDLAGV